MNGGSSAVNQGLRLKPHGCSYCGASFSSLQSLGGHLTKHRREIAEMRRQHEEFMEGQRARRSQEGGRNEGRGLPMVLLTPNHAFWEAYKRVGHQPKVIEYLPILRVTGRPQQPVLVEDSDGSSEETISSPIVMVVRGSQQAQEVNSVNLDLTLGL